VLLVTYLRGGRTVRPKADDDSLAVEQQAPVEGSRLALAPLTARRAP